ncbi:MAG: metallophosphoesterase [Myxococcales bacterium]|nr:metallophosphoesterase [Myxococcales bacterium]
MSRTRIKGVKSIETRHIEERQALFGALKSLDRRSFMKVSAAAMGAVMAKGILPPHSFQPVTVKAQGPSAHPSAFTFAYISDSHLYDRKLNDRFVNQLLRAVDDINAMDPQPDFVFYGGDLSQLAQPTELELGSQILKNVKAPLRMMVGEHDWYLDMGEKWRELFGEPTYSFEHKGFHCVVLNSIIEKDFWTARKLTPMERMLTVAGLDNGVQNSFSVGEEQRSWLKQDLDKVPKTTPLIVFSHSPLYKLYKPWNFWTDDAEEVQKLLKPFRSVVVIHGHTHQILTHRMGNIQFHGMLSTAWPWPYAPEGMPPLTVQMGRPDPFNPHDGLGDGSLNVHPDGMVDKVYNLWNRNPVTITRTYMKTNGAKEKPTSPTLASY